MPHTAAQSGVGLIEVLIAVLVLSIAFLGIAALQAMSLSTNNSAMARSMATIASYSILDAMRADIASARSGAYNTTVTANACSAGTSGTLASAQIYQWCTSQLGNKSLGAVASTKGEIACSAVGTASADCTITITFDDSRAGLGGTSNQQVVTRAML
jgi:type IV pilus assembly protein PilV